ncbi:MAG: S53 family peptidase [Motilibacteraceae bacterium]
MTAIARRAALTALGLAAATVAAVPAASAAPAPAGSSAPAHSRVSPALTGAPHAVFEGTLDRVDPKIHFGCQDTAGCYDPAQIRAAYGFDKLGADGTGRTIVIVDAYQSPTIDSDLALFDSLFGLPAGNLVKVAPDGVPAFDPNDETQLGWSGEITLDVEWAHAIAPGAKLVLVEARSSDDADINSAIRYAVQHNLGDVISMSFGEGEKCMAPALVAQMHQLFSQATAEGITLLASAGDQGAAQPTCDGTSFYEAASVPASDPYVTGVGGTRLVASSSGAYQSETTWNETDTYGSAGGGGFSSLYATPAFQKRLHLPSRGVPDVAYNAAIDGGVLAVFSYGGGAPGLYRFGGTSAGSPQWAGLVADAAQLAGGRIGYLDNKLYGFSASRSLGSRLFHDVTTGDNSFGDITGFAAGAGWDAATGLGSPKAAALVPQLAGQ